MLGVRPVNMAAIDIEVWWKEATAFSKTCPRAASAARCGVATFGLYAETWSRRSVSITTKTIRSGTRDRRLASQPAAASAASAAAPAAMAPQRKNRDPAKTPPLALGARERTRSVTTRGRLPGPPGEGEPTRDLPTQGGAAAARRAAGERSRSSRLLPDPLHLDDRALGVA